MIACACACTVQDFAVALEEHDTDGDGQLSLGEFSTLIRAGSTKRRELFDAIDVDHDGVWSRDEIRAGFGCGCPLLALPLATAACAACQGARQLSPPPAPRPPAG